MRKAIQLKVKLWIEGEDEPAHDFAKYTSEAVQDMISAGRWRHPHLRVTIKKIAEDEDEEDETNGEEAPAATPEPQQSKK
ncbi:MAG TPA: hypothetical protein VE268_04365 [Herpetosiphonaceae bacterium]|nr:hypothetical protein [Herpetosiphonaceae bacterium]